MLTFLSQQAAARFDMKFFLKNKLTLLLISIIFFVQAPYVFAEDQLKIIERDNFQKRMRVNAMTDETTGHLKDYITFSFYVKKQLIFCHMSKDRSAPAVICH